jgi:putative heme-binding domain-containing protein
MNRASSLALLFTFATVGAPAALPVEKPLVVVSNPPAVQMLVPGFTVREIPVQLRNLNNLVYAPDGRLFALGYDGNVYQLKDTDGDGLEDSAPLFFDNTKNEIPPSIGMAWGPGGLYIASRGRILHLRDKGDGTSELQTVTGGWLPPTAAAGSNLDAIGIAVDPAGNIYFGLGVDAWNGAYRVNKQTGVAAYNQFSERGTIIRLSPDWKRRDIISTGLRFPVSLAFNAHGDLFCSDQEGATWLPNGNPFDELLHIVPGRHYGFPPRHPQHLPGVIDEPSVFDYGPQHQSTCGVHFNEPVGGGTAIFGPAAWRGDVFVAGESRGKIWRTKLVKTPAGYVAKNELIAALSMLTIDAVPTPQGDLLVACHSGAPDWGTGPRGQGKLYKISYTDPDAPQPILAFAASPTETRVIFDRPIEPARWRQLASESRLTKGMHVAAGDRFETLTPGYQVVKDQSKTQRYEIPVLSAGLAADRRSLVLRTAPRIDASNYAVTLPDGPAPERNQNHARKELRQQAAIDLLTDLTGLEAEWRDAAGKVAWTGWLPHLDLKVARALTGESEEHARLFALLETPGTLHLRGQLDLSLMLRPAIQPGASLDFEYPSETVTVTLKAAGALQLALADKAKDVRVKWSGDRDVQLTTESREGSAWLPLHLALKTGPTAAELEATWHTVEDTRARALPLRRTLLPWATPRAAGSNAPVARTIPEIAGGDWHRGRQVYAGAGACFACHQMRGEGGVIGPDLSNLVHRDYASVLKDIVDPSAAINPDRIAYTFELKDGTTLSGIVINDTADAIVVGEISGSQRTLAKRDLREMKASAVSLMPPGLWEGLNEQQQRDLMTYLLTEPTAGTTK